MPKFGPPKCRFFRDSRVGRGVIKARDKCMKKAARLPRLPFLVPQALAGSVSGWPSRADRSGLIRSAGNGVKCQARHVPPLGARTGHCTSGRRTGSMAKRHNAASAAKGCSPAASLPRHWHAQPGDGCKHRWAYGERQEDIKWAADTAPTGININAWSKRGAEHFRRAFKQTKINGSFA